MLDLAIEAGIMTKSGAWISYNDEKVAQGREKALEYLSENPEIAENIENMIKEKYFAK